VADLVGLLRSAVAEAVDGNTGAALSGGLDSSTVVCLSPRPLHLFTGYYAMEGYDERPYAALAAMVNGGTWHQVRITPRDFTEHFESMAESLHGVARRQGMGAFGQYMVARRAADFVSTVMSGEGSDELFGGYARTLVAAGEPMPESYRDYVPPEDYPTGDLAAALAYDYERLPDLFEVDDQMLGAWGLTGRAPFTDPEVVEYALALDPRERVGKRHLRDRVRGIVPDDVIDRRDKMGFPVPLIAWAQRDPVRTFVMDRIGWLPDPAKPYDRTMWRALLDTVPEE
jgi:asparagine synthetase B (glutamine-hydrolysing)